MLEIKSNKNSTIKYIKSLSKKKSRWDNMSFIIEGIKLIEEAIGENAIIENIVFSHGFLEIKDNLDFLKKIEGKYKLISLEDSIFREIAHTENPQGILAVTKFNPRDLREIEKLENPVLLFLDELQDPGNLGTIIRSADAFGIHGIILNKGTVDPYNTKVVRSTMGSIFRIPLYFVEDSIKSIDFLKAKNFKIISTSLEGEEVYSYENIGGRVFVIGNESKGVDPKIIHRCDKNIKIPMIGKAESLNAGVAASIIMYETMKSKLL